MIHPHTELRFVNETIGYGLFATRPIPRGTITWVRDDFDQAFTPQQVAAMDQPYRDVMDRYAFFDSDGRRVLCWDLARFVNHSCQPTCLSAGFDIELAITDIAVGEELTDDYGTLNIGGDFQCRCGKPACRGLIRPDDESRLAGQWDRIIQQTFPRIADVAQPLWPLVKPRQRIEDLLKHPAQFKSCWGR